MALLRKLLHRPHAPTEAPPKLTDRGGDGGPPKRARSHTSGDQLILVPEFTMNTPKTPKPLPVRPRRDEHHFKAFDYSVSQFARSLLSYQRIDALLPKGLETRDLYLKGMKNAFFESIAIHMRNVTDFLAPATEKTHKNDLIATDFHPEWVQDKPALLTDERNRVNKYVAHLTDVRPEGSPDLEPWDAQWPLRVLASAERFYANNKRVLPPSAQLVLDDAERQGLKPS